MGARMVQFAALLGKESFACARHRFTANPGKKAGQSVIIFLVPAFGGMVMTLGALNAYAQEQLAERSTNLFGCRQCLVDCGRPILANASPRCENRSNHFIVRSIFRELPAKPAVMAIAPAGVIASRSTRSKSDQHMAQ